MPDFIYMYYVYLNDIDETQIFHHKILIHQKELDMTIMTPSILLMKSFI